jgi:MFS family permease
VNELVKGNASEQELGSYGAYMNAVFLYGWMVGGIVLGMLSDRFGRKKVLAFTVALYGLATLSIVIAADWYLLMALRFLAGIGVGGTLVLSTVMISEIWPEKSRAIIQGILSVSFPVGIVASGGLNLLFSDWRHAFWLGLIPIATSALIILIVPESSKWQSQEPDVATRLTYRDPVVRKRLLTGALIFGSVLIGLWGLFSWLPTWVQSILPVDHTGQQERGFTMMLLGIGGITGGIFSGFIIRWLGNKKTLLIAFTGLAATSLILFLTNLQFSPVVYVEIAALSLFFGISQGALSHYIPELFPVVIRASATGLCFNIGRFFTATAVFFVGTLVTLLGGFSKALLLFSITFIIAWIATFYTRENQKQMVPG